MNLLDLPRPDLVAAAAAVRDANHGTRVTYSPKVFIPLTMLCRDRCGYCTFAKAPARVESPYLTPDDVLAIATAGARAGCHEALFTLGEAPEDRYPVARAWLADHGYGSTIDYLVAMCRLVLDETGLLSHANAGALAAAELAALRAVAPSQGMMVESLRDDLDAHRGAPDKVPARRLATLDAAGELGIPFTTGILVGIGEDRADRLAALEAIAASHRRHGHVQEVIVQNFLPKPGTSMHDAAPCPRDDFVEAIALARLVLPADVHVQAPPNLTDEASLGALLAAGIDDWGGVSPVTADHVNPERPWPALERLRHVTEQHGFELAPRLTIYPDFVADPDRWLDDGVRFAVLDRSDAEGLARDDPGAFFPERIGDGSQRRLGRPEDEGAPDVPIVLGRGSDSSPAAIDAGTGPEVVQIGRQAVPRGEAASLVAPEVPAEPVRAERAGRRPPPEPHSAWYSGASSPPPTLLPGTGAPISGRVAEILEGVVAGQEPGEDELTALFAARGREVVAVAEVADDLRRRIVGDTVTWVRNRNINYTNVCTFKCRFCGFSKGPLSLNLRGTPYLLTVDDIAERTSEAAAVGATEVCLQGGIHPDFDGDFYVDVTRAVAAAAPGIHIHGFTALEVTEGARRLGEPLADYLRRLMDAGLRSLPGTAAEILDDDVRAILCPDKITTDEWLEAHRIAHSVGLQSNVTMMFGAVESPRSWARHLVVTRELQRETGGFTEFVGLPFVHMAAPIYLQRRARRGPTFRETLLVHAVARIAYEDAIPNVQVSWVKVGPDGARQLLRAGCNDLGGTLMDENISRAAGATHGQSMDLEDFTAITEPLGRPLAQRTTLYGTPSSSVEPRAAATAAMSSSGR